MKAKDLRTLEAFLKEYSGAASGQQPPKPGNKQADSESSGNQALDNAVINKANRDRKAAGLPKDVINTELQSKADAGELDNNQDQGTSARTTAATKVNAPPEVRAPGGAGSQVSKVQSSGSPTTGKGQNTPVSESDKISSKDLKKHKLQRKIKRLVRKKKLDEQGEELFFEINFNNPEIARTALDSPIKCGFEAETSWDNVDDGSEGGGQEEVAEYLSDWTDKNSQYQEVKAGEYHSRAGDTKQDYWRVEDDPSISTSGTGSEIISPVYSTPRKMLEEMKSLFAWLENQDASTNSSTGLHVTMSCAGESQKQVNRVKLAVLLGDKYLLSTFGRENSTYALSQYENLEKAAIKLKRNPQDTKTIKQIENILDGGISHDKYSAINFKDETDNETENEIIEFRIGGGADYHKDFNTAAKAVIRYATTMHAAHNEDEYNKDYATALFRLISKIGKISADDEERVKDRINPDVKAPAVDVLKDYFRKDHYVEHLRNLVAAYKTLSEYHALRNQTNEDESGPDQERLQQSLRTAQRYFARAIMQAGYDFSQGHNRATPNAKSIGVLRKALKDFKLDYDTLGQMILAQQDRLDLVDELRIIDLNPKQIIGRIKNGVNKLFKKGVVEEPEYITASQVEKVIQGMWNAVNSGKLSDSQQSITFAKHLAAASGISDDVAAGKLDDLLQQSNQYTTFHTRVMQGGGFNSDPLFFPGSPVNTKFLNRFLKHLKQYPEWDHPVATGHNPGVTRGDSYLENAVKKMMDKMILRFEHLEDIRETDPGLYFDSMREVAKLVQDLIDTNSTAHDKMSDIDDSLHGTEHADMRDGYNYFGMTEIEAERLQQTLKQIDRPDPFSERPPAHILGDSLLDYIGGSLTIHYKLKSRSHPDFFKMGVIPELIGKRTKAIQKFLTGFDKIGQKLGFNSQQRAIDKKLKLDKKQAKFNKKLNNPELAKKADADELSSNQAGGVSPGSTTASKDTKEPMGESDKLKKFRPRGAFGRSAVKNTLKKKLPTGRLLKEADQPEFVVEINFNSKEVVSKALNGPVNCGFEAELIFPRIQQIDPYEDDDNDDSMIDRIANSEYESEIRELYRKTLLDYDNAYGEAFYEYQMEQMNRDFEDEDWLNDFVRDTIDDNDIVDYRKETLDGLDKDSDEYEDRADWSEDAWGRELAELKYKDEMQDYWMDLMDEYRLERLVNRFEDNRRYGIDNWMMDSGEAGNENWTNANEYLQMGDDGSYREGGSSKQEAYDEVEKWLFDWAKMNSHNADIEVGGYHETEGHDGWRIEEDGSLDGDGAGFEVISPVFETPKEMLKEIKSLFQYAQGSTDTNRTTGLHVTMSYAEPSDVPTNIAKTKMYVLSGADNQAKVWGREFNSYSQSTKVQVLQALRAIATGNASEDNIKTMDDMITQFDASGEANKVGRQSTVNVKQRRNSAGNSLVEFRAAGGPGYIDDFGQVAKDVTRYSATIQASYDEEAYNKEFAKKMYKWLQDAADVEDPQAYSSTKGLSPQDVYRQSTGDTSFDVDNHPLTDYMMRFAHSTFHDNVKQTLTRFFSSLKTMQDYAQKHDLQLNEYEENPEEVMADFKFSTAEAFTDLLGYLALSPNTDKMNTKELMAIRKLIRKYGVNQEEILKALKRDTGNPRLIPDPRDKADRTRIYKRMGRLIGKDLMGDAPEPMAIFIAPDQLAVMTADTLRYIQQYGDTEDAYLPMKETDYNYIQTEIKALNELFKKSQANPDDTDLDVEVRKAAFELAKTISTRFNKELGVERIMQRQSDGGLQYALTWQNQIARPHTHAKIAQNLKTLGVEVKPTEEKQAPFESLMSRFEGRSLQEQLMILNKLDKTKIDEAYEKITFRENTVPDNRTVTIINDLLSEHFPAGDLDKQMEAFTAIPMPEMIDSFRSLERTQGPDACCRGVLCKFINYLHPTIKDQITSDFCDGKSSDPKKSQCQPCSHTINENLTKRISEAKGIMGRVTGDKFVNGDNQLEFQKVKVYPEDSAQYQSTEERDQAIQSFESQAGPIVWTNAPNKGMLAFGVATLTDPLNNNKPTYWGRYFKQKTTNMMGVWQNNQVPAGWKVQKAGALKLDIGIDPQHLIKVETPFSSIDQVIQTVSKNSKENPLHEQLVLGLEQIKSGRNPVFKDCAQHIPALRDYFGEIMGPCALMASMVGGQAEDANQALLKGAGWNNSQVFWPQAMNYALVDSVFIGPEGQEVGISSKGGKGAKASAKNIADAIAKAPPELVKKYKFTVNIIKLVEQSSAQEGPFRIAEFLKLLPAGLEKEIMSYVKSGKTDYVGLSDDAKELFNYGTPKTDAPGFNTGLALTALLAKKVAKKVNENPTFSDGAISFLNQSSIVQLYCKMGKQGNDARVTGWDAIYPPNFKGRVVLDGSKNYYSSRIGGKFAFGFV